MHLDIRRIMQALSITANWRDDVLAYKEYAELMVHVLNYTVHCTMKLDISKSFRTSKFSLLHVRCTCMYVKIMFNPCSTGTG